MMNVDKLWEERLAGYGTDTHLVIHGKTLYAHWCILSRVLYFRRQAKGRSPGLSTRLVLEIPGEHFTPYSLERILQFIYLNNCFINNEKDVILIELAQFMESKTLKSATFDALISNSCPIQCLETFVLGTCYNLLPLKQKSWTLAIQNGQVITVQHMIHCGMNVNTVLNGKKQTALHMATEYGYTDIIQLLLQACVDVDLQDCQGKTPLNIATSYRDQSTMQLLLQNGSDPNIDDQWGHTALHKACCRGDTTSVQLLLHHGARVALHDKNRYDSLHLAALGGHGDVVDILQNTGATWKVADEKWLRTSLYMSAWNGHSGLLTKLLRLQILMGGNCLTSRSILTPLHAAVEAGHTDVVNLLIREKPELMDIQDWNGSSPLHYAARSGDHKIASLLANNGANQRLQDNEDQTALQVASKHNFTETVKSLLYSQDEYPVNIVDEQGLTALHYAANNGNEEMMQLLLQSGALFVSSHNNLIRRSSFDKNIRLIVDTTVRLSNSDEDS